MVIRRALEQSAQPLALMHLRSPSEELERMLLDLLVSAYRVLDPRRRQDPQSRVMLGRLHPQLADEAVQVAQARLAAPQSPTLTAVVPPPVEKSDRQWTTDAGRRADDVQQPTPLERTGTLERFIDTAMVPGWEATLSSPDLLVQLPTTRVYRAAKRHLVKAPFASVLALAVLAGCLLLAVSGWMLMKPQTPPSQQPLAAGAEAIIPARRTTSPASMTAAVVPGPQKLPAPDASISIAATPQPSEWAAVPSAPLSAPFDGATAPSLAPDVTDTIALESLPEWNVADDLATSEELASAELQPWPAMDESPSQIATASQHEVPAIGLAALEQSLLARDKTQPLLAEWDGDWESLAVLETNAQQAGEPAPVRATVPTPTEQAAARLQIETLVRSYRNPAAEADTNGQQLVAEPVLADGLSGAERQIALLRVVASESAAGSARQWVAIVLAGQAALLADREEDTRQAIAELTHSFAVDADEATLQLARWAAGDIINQAQRQRLGQWLDEQVRVHVLDGELTVAGQLVGIAHELGVKHRDETIKSQSKLWRDSLAVAQRYAEAAQRLEAQGADQLSAEERGMVGRYWALVRRDWHQALPHLAAGANVKLAHYAGIELLAGEVPDAQDATLLAEGYLSEAKRSKGWLADSYVLHAHELLVTAAAMAGEDEALQLAQAAEKLRAEQPTAFVDG